MGMVMLPPGVTWEQYTAWLQGTPEGRQYSQYINQVGAGTAGGVSHAPPIQHPGAFRPIAPPAGPSVPQAAPLSFEPVTTPPSGDEPLETPEEMWKNAQPGRAQPIQPQSQGTPLQPPGSAGPAAPNSPPAGWGQLPQQDFGHRYDPWAGAVKAPGQPLNKSGPSIGPTKYIGRDGKPMYAY